MHQYLKDALGLASQGSPLPRAAAEALLSIMPGEMTSLISVAGVAASSGGARPFTCGIINAKSGRCAENCAFCAQSAHYNTDTTVHPLVSDETLFARAESLSGAGVGYMGIVTSGTGPSARDFEKICSVAEKILDRFEIKLCASLGILGPGQAAALKQAGFTSYHHNLETSAGYYPEICTTHEHSSRVETVKNAKSAGLRVCSGGIFGLGESWKDRLDLAENLAELQADSVPVNFLSPIPGTPLERAKGMDRQSALILVAILRLMLPHQDIVICGGRGATMGEWDNVLSLAGANGLMVGDYLTTSGNEFGRDMEMLRTLGVIR